MSFSFGTPSSAPATTGLTGGFSFGANKPATPGFGLTAASQPSTGLFGATTATPATAFGSTFAPTSFGGTTTPAFGTSAPAFGTSAPAFGASAPSAFGTNTPAPAFGTTTPAFGAPTTAPSFGTTPATSTTGFAAPFGATTTPSFGLGTGGLNFGAGTSTSAPSTGLTFATPTTTPSLGGFGGGLGFTGAAPQTSSFSLFPSTTTTTSNTLFGPKPGGTSVTGTLPSTSVTASVGLGGAAHSTSGIGAANANADAKSDPPKQQKLPNEISTTVESFKEFVKKQKSLSSEVMRVSVKPLYTVSKEADTTLRLALSLHGALVRTRAAAKLQRHAAVTAIAAAEAAARDHAHPGSELEGSAPPPYVKELIPELEQKLISFRAHMDSADKQMQSSPKLLTEQELNLGFRRMHESLVALAGRLQAVHTQVQAQKEQYLNLRKYILKDPTDVFATPTPTSSLDQILRDLDGGRKKMKSSAIENSSMADPRTRLGNINLAGPSPFVYAGGFSPYPLADNNAPTWQPQATPTATTLGQLNTSGFGTSSDSSVGFQLQKPPGKRGKQ